jgi:Tfp pilus assembly protein PilE
MHASADWRSSEGFTLLEICTAIAVIFILALLMIPGYETVRMRMDKVSCTNNLRQLYVSANAYVQEHGSWPQVNPALLQAPNHAYDNAWIEAFMPYGAGRATWICPTIERDLGGPDYTQEANYRADYIAMPFDIKRYTPFRWNNYPWFVERGNVHGNGNLMIVTSGGVAELTEMVPKNSGASPAPSP